MGTLAAGIKEIFATAKTTGSNVMLCGNDGTPDGHMTMANLASVLGGIMTKTISDFNSCVEDGMYKTFNIDPCSNRPKDGQAIGSGALLFVGQTVGQYYTSIEQICILTEKSGMFRRYRGGSSGSWTDWTEFATDMPTFYKDYNDITALASGVNTASWKYITLAETGTEGKLFTPTDACIFVLMYDSGKRCGMYSYDKESRTIKTVLAAPRVVVGAHTDNSQYYMWVNAGDIYISSAASQAMRFNYLVLGL